MTNPFGQIWVAVGTMGPAWVLLRRSNSLRLSTGYVFGHGDCFRFRGLGLRYYNRVQGLGLRVSVQPLVALHLGSAGLQFEGKLN